MDTLVDDRHDTDLFLKVLFCLFFLVELRVSAWKCDLHVDEISDGQDFIRRPKNPFSEDKNQICYDRERDPAQ